MSWTEATKLCPFFAAVRTRPGDRSRVQHVHRSWSRIGRHCLQVAKRLFVISYCLGLSLCCAQSVPRFIEHARDVLVLSSEDAARAISVTLHAVVTCTTDYGLFVEDRTSGIWIDWSHPKDFAPGDELKIKGHSNVGIFSPTVTADSIQKLGKAPVPSPRPANLRRLLSGDEESQYVSVIATVRSIGFRPNVHPHRGFGSSSP
jgi:hypothetical protein